MELVKHEVATINLKLAINVSLLYSIDSLADKGCNDPSSVWIAVHVSIGVIESLLVADSSYNVKVVLGPGSNDIRLDGIDILISFPFLTFIADFTFGILFLWFHIFTITLLTLSLDLIGLSALKLNCFNMPRINS